MDCYIKVADNVTGFSHIICIKYDCKDAYKEICKLHRILDQCNNWHKGRAEKMYFSERIPARYDITIAHCIDVELEDVLETEDPTDYVVIKGFRCNFKRMKDVDDYVNLHDKHVRDFLNNYFDIIR
jgi:hypothetical protein